MRYITPYVPNIKVTDNFEKETIIDYVYKTDIINLKDSDLIMIEVPFHDEKVNELFMDYEYNLQLDFDTRDFQDNKIYSKPIKFENMKLIRYIRTCRNDSIERIVYVFYNGEDNSYINNIINSSVQNNTEDIRKTIQQEIENYTNKINMNQGSDGMKLRIKYFEGAKKLEKISKGNWIDVFANKDVFVPVRERAMIPLGFALELPKGWEGHLAPRSSTFKTWGVIQTNHVGVVDDTFIGDNDQWHMPVYCLQNKGYEYTEEEIMRDLDEKHTVVKETDKSKLYNCQTKEYICGRTNRKGTWIHKGDKIGQFRIMEIMPELEFEEVESFGNVDRGGFGTSGCK